MARITVEDCLEKEPNRFALVRLASERAKQLADGELPLTDTRGNKPIVSALREVAAGKVKSARVKAEVVAESWDGSGEVERFEFPVD